MAMVSCATGPFRAAGSGPRVQLGFVIDHGRCIGCHACTVACKAENLVPLGSFRTWVKQVEEGEFPEVRRSFAVLRCNQCSDAPCVTICPVAALQKRSDGIVDVDPAACIGCKACLQGCPYDALYLNEGRGTVEKCHFCAHRTEVGLAPACAVICPTEAIIPGDFDDPGSIVSHLKATGDLSVRKAEAGTRPNVLYREVTESAVRPLLTSGAGGYLWADRLPGPQLEAEEYEAMEFRAQARTVYDVAHPPAWGWKVSAYLFTKSVAGGAAVAGAILAPAIRAPAPLAAEGMAAPPLLGLLFLAITTVLLVADLKRPERFLKILTRPNWRSWLARGTLILMAYGLALSAWAAAAVLGVAVPAGVAAALIAVSAVLGAATAAYTAWLFRQARGRPLWMRRGLAWHLTAQAGIAGCAALLLLAPAAGIGAAGERALRLGLALSLLAHLALTLTKGRAAPRGREEEYRRAANLISWGPYSRRHWVAGVGAGTLLPLLLLGVASGGWPAAAVASALALAGLMVEEDLLVRAGQALAIS